jgi:Ca2+-binding RTX toxin-like protein
MAFVTVHGGQNVSIGNQSDTVTVYGPGPATVHAGTGDSYFIYYDGGKAAVGNGNNSIYMQGNGTINAGSGNNNIVELNWANDTISVGAGNDNIWLWSDAKVTEQGAGGNDTIHLAVGNDTIGVQGHATVVGQAGWSSFGSATIAGGELVVKQSHPGGNQANIGTSYDSAVGGHITMMGGAAPTEFLGGTGTTVMLGGSGSDTFQGGSGHDTMTGGTGPNAFEFVAKDAGGHHVITNFTSGDQLYVEGLSLSYLQSHNDITTSGGNTTINIDGGKTSIVLQGFTGLTSSEVITHKP